MTDPDETRAHIKRAFASYGLDEPDDETCDRVLGILRDYHAAGTPVTLGDLLVVLAPRRSATDAADLDLGTLTVTERIRDRYEWLRYWFWRCVATVRGWFGG